MTRLIMFDKNYASNLGWKIQNLNSAEDVKCEWTERINGNGCGGAWDYYEFKYQLIEVEYLNRYKYVMSIEYSHNDSCHGQREIIEETRYKQVDEYFWEAEQDYILDKYGLKLPEWPIEL